MKESLAEDLAEVITDLGYETAIMDDYSGRGMYGDRTYAVTFPNFAVLCRAVFCLGEHNDVGGFDESDFNIKFDNMGRDYVAY